MEDYLVEQRKGELIAITEKRAFQEKVYWYAYQLTRNRMDAEDYSQEAITRFIAAVKNKTSVEEMKNMHSLRYIYVILDHMHADKLKKISSPRPQEKPPDQTNQPRGDNPEHLGRQKRELLAAQLGESVEDIANHLQEIGKIVSTRLGMEEKVISEIIVKEFLNSLPEELREIAVLLYKEYKLSDLTKILNLSYKELKIRKDRIKDALNIFKQKMIDQEEIM